jgi:hypothetical protein
VSYVEVVSYAFLVAGFLLFGACALVGTLVRPLDEQDLNRRN